jgi:hypothetical protein
MVPHRNGRIELVSSRCEVQLRNSPLCILCYGGAMGSKIRPEGDAEKLEGCLARLRQELVVLDQLEATLAALKVSEACDALEHELEALQAPPPAD